MFSDIITEVALSSDANSGMDIHVVVLSKDLGTLQVFLGRLDHSEGMLGMRFAPKCKVFVIAIFIKARSSI